MTIQKKHQTLTEVRRAIFSDCETYRYILWVKWDERLPVLGGLFLNPSTATHLKNDPTIERFQRRATVNGYGGIVIMNAYGLRSTNPQGLYKIADPNGPDNDALILKYAAICETIICGWGAHCDKVRKDRSAQLRGIIKAAGRVPQALKINADGSPQHPLYVSYDTQPFPMPEAV